MKKGMKKALAALLAAVTMLFAGSVTAGAESIADTAKTRYNGDSFSIKLADGKAHDYKIKLTKGGDLKIGLTSACYRTNITVYDADGGTISPSKSQSTVKTGGFGSDIFGGGPYPDRCYWNETVEKFKGEVVYTDLDKGTYYIRIQLDRSSSYSGQGKASIKFTFPGKTAEESGAETTKVDPTLSVALKKGETLSLGTVEAGSDVSWSTSDKTVASVAKSGKVTANAKGSAVVEAKAGDTSLKITVVVEG
ncbi:MAG: Ig-like domain-containing protein [Bacteroides sp.]|nr:Ig-like domain-containing protein [Eubacterium sp.]MCM1419335.1 Ig-like domain-containing protein [Roseburia sp.]MCM1462025.1 Ig-like domain-containing protein [Bacteroides sp.]